MCRNHVFRQGFLQMLAQTILITLFPDNISNQLLLVGPDNGVADNSVRSQNHFNFA